jgi:hypothetical protein
MIPYGRQDISAEDIDAVTEVLRSDWLTQGQAGPRIEQAWLPIAAAAARLPYPMRPQPCTSPASLSILAHARIASPRLAR